MNSTLASMQHQGLIFNAKAQSEQTESCPLTYTPTGFSELDALLQGGWPDAGVISVFSQPAIGEFRLLQALLSAQQSGLIILINPPAEPCAHWLAQLQIASERVVILRPKSDSEALWAAEQCARSSSCALIWLWQEGLSFTQVRRFNLACQQSQAVLVLLSYSTQPYSLPVQLSVHILPTDSGLTVRLLRQQGRFASGEVHLRRTQLWPFLHYSDLHQAFKGGDDEPLQHVEVG
ncbi:hypothetical protein [Pseudoalteromonas ruthenica]|uniref:Recombinase RecA n=1 Tax=Pseudoalteromonas ruthenica TaxID=151081 RepID=A0A0F4PS95_9GAMM|nr:hypothetical protein [Pseudoalteromonas ruthenica]KJY94838.1 hypothetical protein TW76_17455 [Pseudoalteromonas ruthenica]KJY98302.1 hypothetical protein TW72_11085 [Pseudoalteromonas ruthenica]TMO93905.1 hypothetical protein CWC13_03680 [Pseudoalteromonas ruthenica]